MRSLSLLVVVPLLVACGKVVVDRQPAGAPNDAAAGDRATGGIGGGSSTAPPVVGEGGTHEVLCDGSAAMRLAYVSMGGFAAQSSGFTNPRGAGFLGIDGECRYFVEDNYMHGIVSGTLTPAEAELLSAELHWNDLDAWAHYRLGKDASCPDAGGFSLLKADASSGCSCGCDAAAPRGLEAALDAASRWTQKLKSAGKPLEGPVSAVIVDSSIGNAPRQPEFEWPLSRPIDSIPDLVDHAEVHFMRAEAWARFDDPAEYTKLRELRSATINSNGFLGQAVLLRDHGKQYDLYVRDELPAETERAWKELQATVPR